MDAVTVVPGQAHTARLEDISEPDPSLGSVVVEAIAVGVCGTDLEITRGSYGWAPPGRERLILGHESLGRVVDPGPSGLSIGDQVVGIVRRPDPVPCPNCAVGEWDMCSNGGYTERGIKQIDGFMSQRWRIEPEYAVRVDRALGILGVLLEPATVVAKAWEQILAIGQRTFWEPETVLVIGAGPIGLLAALLGVQRGLDVHVLDRVTSGPKPDVVRDHGASYHTGRVADLRLQAHHHRRVLAELQQAFRPKQKSDERPGSLPHRNDFSSPTRAPAHDCFAAKRYVNLAQNERRHRQGATHPFAWLRSPDRAPHATVETTHDWFRR